MEDTAVCVCVCVCPDVGGAGVEWGSDIISEIIMLLLYERLKASERYKRASWRENRMMSLQRNEKWKHPYEEKRNWEERDSGEPSMCSDSAEHMTVGSTPAASFM